MRRPFTAFLIVAGLGVIAAVVGRCWDKFGGPGSGQGREAVLAEACGARTTATREQTATIRALRQAASTADGLAAVTIDYPIDGSVFPPEIVQPTVLWHDSADQADTWLIDVVFGDAAARIGALVPDLPLPEPKIDSRCVTESNVYEPTAYQASAKHWRPSSSVWSAIKKHSTQRPATLSVIGFSSADPTRVLSRGRVTLTTSTDPVDAPIFYRDVPLMPTENKEGVIKPLSTFNLPLVAWRLRDLSKPESRVLLEGLPTCANCHSFSRDGTTLGMDVDGPTGDKGTYAIAPISRHMAIKRKHVITWNSFNPRHKTIGFMAQVSPDGRYAVATLNEEVYVANFTDYRFLQVFYPTAGILAYYSRATGEMKALPGADDPRYVHCDPCWSPDGKHIVFARAPAKPRVPVGHARAGFANDPNETPIQYDLHRMPFNDGMGGKPAPVAGASSNGMSNTFPKISPDGKFIVFVKCRNGQLMRPDSELWIVPAERGEARRMRCNTRLMNSWHSFSPNGRWLVFASKANTPYTQMFLTHLDEDGNDTPAILIENSTASNRAVNIPEFVNVSYGNLVDITIPSMDYRRHAKRGEELMMDKRRIEEAIREFKKALEGEPDDANMHARIHNNLSLCYSRIGERDLAAKHFREAMRTAATASHGMPGSRP